MKKYKSYLLVALNRGWVDGFYFTEEGATEAFNALYNMYPEEGWVMTAVHANPQHNVIPDHTFHARVREMK